MLIYYQDGHNHNTRVGMKGKTIRSSRIFLYGIQSGFAHILTSTPTDRNMEMGSNSYLHQKKFYSKKDNYFFKV